MKDLGVHTVYKEIQFKAKTRISAFMYHVSNKLKTVKEFLNDE